MDLIATLASHLTPYITISGLAGHTYTYRKRFGDRQFPVMAHTMHQRKGAPGAMLYVAVAAEADLHQLKQGQKLYVGSQGSVDRMFRGDGLNGGNFHHAQMREGNHGQGLETHVACGGKVVIYAISSSKLAELADSIPQLRKFKQLASGEVALSRGRNHAGFWAEQTILRDELAQWAWNSQGTSSDSLAILRRCGI